mgnify:FL=1
MMDAPIYGRTSFRAQYEEALQTFLTKEQLSDEEYKKKIGDDIIEAYVKFRFRPQDFFLFGLKDKDDSERDTFVTDTLKDSVLMEVEGFNKYTDELSDKWRFYQLVGQFFAREVMNVNRDTPFEEFRLFSKRHPSLFIKQNRESYGHGTFRVDIANDLEARAQFSKMNEAGGDWVVEELIEQSAEMAKWNASSVNTVRICSFLNKKGYKQIAPFMRTGRKGMIVDNGGSGGVMATIDPQTGIINSDGYDEYGKVFKVHPDSKIPYKGMQIPKWKELIELAEKVHRTMSDHIYIAFDFAYTNKGWVLVEGNWGQFVCQQTCLKKGFKKEFLEYMYGGSIS